MSNATPAEERELPTFSECVVGFRGWHADDESRLWPLHSGRRPWLPGVNTARCNCASHDSLKFSWSLVDGRRVLEREPEHAAPDPGCVCGLYSLRRPPKSWARARPGLVIGAVACWGRLQVHARGFRAEHACVVALAHRPGTSEDRLGFLRDVAARYRVELVPLSELEEAASEHGTPLPDALRPERESAMPDADPSPAAHARGRAPDASVEEVGTPRLNVGFHGGPLQRQPFEGFHGM